MANYNLMFNDCNENDGASLEVYIFDDIISINGFQKGEECQVFCIHLDKSTAIKFAKTLRTEINKIGEVNND